MDFPPLPRQGQPPFVRPDMSQVVDEQARTMLGEGASYVGGHAINLNTLLEGFEPDVDLAASVKEIEFIPPMIQPYGCGPVAPADWVVLHTYNRIIEMRHGTRMDDQGLVLSDELFNYCYQEAFRELNRKQVSSPQERSEIIEGHFRILTPQLWHRHLFPFGTYAYANTSSMDTSIRQTLHMGRDASKHMINPYSVSHADILYLCNTSGYLDRYMRIIAILLWAKREDTNLLIYRRFRSDKPTEMRSRSETIDGFFTLERHLHVFGSIWLHIEVMRSNKQQVGGNWSEKLKELESWFHEMTTDFNVNRDVLERHIRHLTLRSMTGSLSGIQNFFRSTSHVSDSK